MDHKVIHYHLHLRRAEMLRERNNDRLAKVASEVQRKPIRVKFYSVWVGWLHTLVKSYYNVKAIRPSVPTSPIPARGEGE
jgi:hypothetical protein